MKTNFRGRMFIEGGVREATLVIEDGLIIGVDNLAEGAETVDIPTNRMLLPAGVETLAAMRDWAETERDTIETVTRAALNAGVTLVCDQANTVPRINSIKLAEQRMRDIAASSYTDFAVSAHPPVDRAEISSYRAAGILGLQMFSWDLRPWNEPHDTDESPATFARYAEAGVPALIFVDEHALRQTELRDISESYAMKALLERLPADFSVRLYTSDPGCVEMALEAKGRLPNLRLAVPPHHVFMSREEGFRRIGLGATQMPALRPAADVERMQSFAEQGLFDFYMSHHAPHRMCDKHNDEPVPGELTPKAGYTGIDFTYPLLMTKLGLAEAVRGYSEAPAAFLGVKKGRLARGYDADFALVEEDAGATHQNIHVTGKLAPGIWRIDPAKMFQSKGHVTPFTGERLMFKVMETWLRGEKVFDRAENSYRRVETRQVR